MKKRKIITLLTDFGCRDYFTGILKGVILSINPDVEIVDISHETSSFDILEGSLKLAWSWKYFPAGTIHVAVIDPGVGGKRNALIVNYKDHFFVTPDNGILSYILKDDTNFKAVKIEEKKYMLKDLSCSFHARDIFCPAAAYLAKGIKLKNFGPLIKGINKLILPSVKKYKEKIQGQIIYIDKFGNCISNIENKFADKIKRIKIKKYLINKISNCYKDKPDKGSSAQIVKSRKYLPVAIKGSGGYLEVSLPEKNASDCLKIKKGDKITAWGWHT